MLNYTHFVVVRDRLYRVCRDTQSEEDVTKLLAAGSGQRAVQSTSDDEEVEEPETSENLTQSFVVHNIVWSAHSFWP